MALSDIAAELEFTIKQEEQGVPTSTNQIQSLREQLRCCEDDLPCDVKAAEILLEQYRQGVSISDAAIAADLPETIATITLFLLGQSVEPLSSNTNKIIKDWVDGSISTREAERAVGENEIEFAIAAFIATHEPLLDPSALADNSNANLHV